MFWPPGAQKTSKSDELSAKIKVFAFFQGRSKTETQKAPKRAPREAKMSPRSCSGGPKSGPRGPKTAPRAARSAPRGAQEQPGAHQKGPKRGPGRPRSAKKSSGTPPGPILALRRRSRGQFWPHFWGPGLHLKQFILPDVLFIRRNSRSIGFYAVPRFPSLCGTTWTSPRPEITRKCCSKSLVKRSFETAAGQKHTRTMAQWPV